eukprot:TRINITY_DN44216_c0_g1_i1.p1 TRINITY_DN44216_c0_g1~~TRINITY_DN44216_c0_g1_i1.p1  ORF type:complete len:285 (-),score=48.57 TRINITY_DN44216_c0_g1_i1:624-1478(-)
MAAPPRQSCRRRGYSFRAEYCTGVAPRVQSPLAGLKRAIIGRGGPGQQGQQDDASRRRAPSMVHEPSRHMIPAKRRDDRSKLTVVLDLDETLIYAREGPLYCRPHLDELLEFLGDKCETVVWTAGIRPYAQAVIKNIDPYGIIQHCVYRHAKWFSGQPGYVKDLGLIGRDLDRMVIIENTPDCVRGFENNGILVPDYEGGETPDSTLLVVKKILQEIADSHLTVPEVIAQSTMLTKRWVPTEYGDNIPCYVVDPRAFTYQQPKVNRDLAKYQQQQQTPALPALR